MRLAGCAVGALGCFPSSPAAAAPQLSDGTHELSLHISPDFESAIGDMILIDAGYGVFVRDRIELRAVFDHVLMEDIAGADEDYRMQQLGLVGEYHLETAGAAVPYLALGIGWARSEFGALDESALVYGPRVGVKYFLADTFALDFEAAYQLASADVFINDFVAEDHDLSLGFGLRVFF